MLRISLLLSFTFFLTRPGFCPAQDDGERLVWKAFDERTGKPFFQELRTQTKQVMKVMGMDVTQTQDQTFVIRWTPHLPDRNQNWIVTQEIVRAKMDVDVGGNKIVLDTDRPDGGGMGNPGLQDFFKAMINQKLRFTIDRRMQVKEVQGHEAIVKKLADVNPGLKPMLETMLSREAMIQMVEPTLAAFPVDLVKKGSKWERTAELKMSPIGTYVTTYTFAYEGKEGFTDKISAATKIRYAPPREKVAGMPFTIKRGDLRGRDGKGLFFFDRDAGRLARGEMSMTMEGELVIEIGGMETSVQLQQTQVSTFRNLDERPK